MRISSPQNQCPWKAVPIKPTLTIPYSVGGGYHTSRGNGTVVLVSLVSIFVSRRAAGETFHRRLRLAVKRLYFTRVGLRLRLASGGRKSPDFCNFHAVNQGIDIPRSPKKYLNSDRSHYNTTVSRPQVLICAYAPRGRMGRSPHNFRGSQTAYGSVSRTHYR